MEETFMINQLTVYDKVRKVSRGQGDDYTADSLLDYAYFKDNYKLIAVDFKLWMPTRKQFNKYYFKELLEGKITQK